MKMTNFKSKTVVNTLLGLTICIALGNAGVSASDLIDVDSKKEKEHPAETPSTTINLMDLPTECLLKIAKALPIPGLAELSSTSVRLYNIAHSIKFADDEKIMILESADEITSRILIRWGEFQLYVDYAGKSLREIRNLSTAISGRGLTQTKEFGTTEQAEFSNANYMLYKLQLKPTAEK